MSIYPNLFVTPTDTESVSKCPSCKLCTTTASKRHSMQCVEWIKHRCDLHGVDVSHKHFCGYHQPKEAEYNGSDKI